MEHGPYNSVGPVIRKLRNEKNLTQVTLAARCGVAGYEISRGTLAKIESQIRGVPDIELFVIAGALGVKIEELFPPRFKARLKAGEFARKEE